MRTWTQLTQTQRYQIYTLQKMGHQQTEIAKFIGVDKSTISRELRRNQGQRGYRPKQAHNLAMNRRKQGQGRIDSSGRHVDDNIFNIVNDTGRLQKCRRLVF